MRKIIFTLIAVVFGINTAFNQCNTNTDICVQGTAGPYGFTTADNSVSTCLDFRNGLGAGAPNYSFIILYITSSGPLEMLIDGNSSSGFLDVAVFNIPAGVAPCVAIQDNSNQISCNYASNADGCAEFGSWSTACNSEVPSPTVTAGDVLMIVVEDWSDVMANFTMSLSGNPGTANTGPADATIISPGAVDNQTPAFTMNANDNGGTWTASCGACIDPVTGIFDPGVAGPGTHTINYTIGSPPCDDQDATTLDIAFNPLPVTFGDFSLACEENGSLLQWNTWSEQNNDYFLIEVSNDGEDFREYAEVEGSGNTSNVQNYELYVSESYKYFRLTQFDFDGEVEVLKTIINNCINSKTGVSPNPFENTISIYNQDIKLTNTDILVFSSDGKQLFPQMSVLNGVVLLNMHTYSSGMYHIQAIVNGNSSSYKVLKK